MRNEISRFGDGRSDDTSKRKEGNDQTVFDDLEGNEQGRVVAFSAWLHVALALRDLTPKGLADESKRLFKEPMSPGHLGSLLRGEVSPGNRKVTRPTREFIKRVAKLTGADEQTGLQAAGYWPPPSALSGCRVRYVLIPEECPEDTELVLTQVAQLLASKRKNEVKGNADTINIIK